MENNKIAALVEIGILCRGEDVPVADGGSPDPGPHAYSGHNQFCRYESPHYQFPYGDSKPPAFVLFKPDTTMAEALGRTRLFVFLGAADSPEFRAAMAQRDALVFLFEADDRALEAFLETAGLPRLNREGFFLFTGDPRSFNPALMDMLPSPLFKRGTPAFFLTERIRRDYGEWADGVIEYMEILHYRHAVYPLSGQFLARSHPLRDIKRSYIFDQVAHAFDNVPAFLRFPELSRLRNRMRGGSAILVAAGPDLATRLDYIRANRDRAVVIAVNNALKPLAEAGIHPHMAVINDVSLIAGKVFSHIPRMPETILVAQCLCDLGDDRFVQKFLFDDYLPDVFGHRGKLRLHGSVISTAFSLAEYLGCARTVLVGAQLCSNNPWGLNYVQGTVKDAPISAERPLINRHPQLCPVTTPFGETLYTTLNFRDAALWLAEVVRLSGMACVNTSRQSILYGRGIEYDEAPALEPWDVDAAHAALFRVGPTCRNFAGAADFLRREAGLWRNVRQVSEHLLQESGPVFVAKGMAILGQMDRTNISYMLQRFEEFYNRRFHRWCFEGDGSKREYGLRYYFEYVERMSRNLLERLAKSSGECRKLAGEAGIKV
ncbi:6-hydroxymethylpterin diphosphokinase MptE-like protein [Pseudodesulfovibrio sp.]|uniref:6-hydroxymethylpterin diphosphokinase MptE-like protein n=1 Tax=Pseudodesulfovibrio sp. TaxID=2035812 RepID=UPI00261DE699|nr:6-hydroxymethylpterin diphosphokinase MptE-like protein [Pseudodesulfovibrio sp.]MDD3311674.1 DUF115 domain-containing protein [Pseudodesulfovibrio sp.]